MKYHYKVDSDICSNSYEQLEAVIRKHFTATRLSYREVAAVVGWSHTQLWSFHKQNCKLQFEVLDRLALLFNEPYLLTNSSSHSRNAQQTHTSVEEIVHAVRTSLDEAATSGISYRKIGKKTGISHEWVRCFHVKKATIEVRKLLSLANFLGIAYELSNAKALIQNTN